MNRTILLATTLLASCAQQATESASPTSSKKTQTASNSTPYNNNNSNPDPKPDPDDTISIPSGITGASLTCGSLSDASSQLPTAEIGCRLSDAQGDRVDPSGLGVKANFSVSALPANVKLKQRSPNYVARSFDSIFEIAGKTEKEVAAALATMKYTVELKAIIGGESLSNKSVKFAETKIQPKRADWVSYLYESSPTYVDQVTSLVWALDNGKGYTLQEGHDHCNGLIYADSDAWRLPTIVELRTAHLDGLGVAYADPGNMNIDSQRFAGYLSSTLELPDQAPVIGVSKVWTIDLGKKADENISLALNNDRKSVICVHE